MAKRWTINQTTILYGICAIIATANATPGAAFPFNSQVPTVARVGQRYAFQFSATTFTPDPTNFTYSLSDQPFWLSIESATHTLSGTPSQADVGANTFTLTAADDTGVAHMACTLVVATDPPPQMEGDISQQLAATANLSSSQPPVVTILPASPFNFEFKQGSFIDVVQRTLHYYATLADHTPLPSWLQFDKQRLSFSGIAPQLSAFPQAWDVDLIASDVQGFAGARVSFTVAVGTQQLVFVPQQYQLNITSGMQLEFTSLRDTLFLNGDNVTPESLKAANASLPSWLSFDSSTLSITGTVPDGIGDQDIAVTVQNRAGNQATALMHLVTGQPSLFTGSIGTLTAQSGQTFSYRFENLLFATLDLELRVILPASAKWLKFDSSTLELTGQVPTQTSSSTIQATLSARAPEIPETQLKIFTIDIQGTDRVDTTSTGIHTEASHKSGAGSSKAAEDDEERRGLQLSNGVVAAIVLGTLIGLAALVACLIICLRKRRRPEGYVETTSTAKRTISRPILPPDMEALTVTTELQTDVEKTSQDRVSQNETSKLESTAPQIALNLPMNTNGKRSKWSKRFSRISLASSLGVGEDAIRADSNIPEFGRQSTALHTPHDSFSVPAEIARSSRQLSDLSPSKRALRRLRDKRHSRQSIGLGIDTGGVGLMPGHSFKAHGGRVKAASSLGLTAAMNRSSNASLSTRGTSLLSTRPSEFPRPPTRSTFRGSKSIPAIALSDAQKRKSIRLVAENNGARDSRCLQDKRQSFIRNRASTSFASPLFAHGSRASSNPLQNGRVSGVEPSLNSTRRSQRGKSQLTTYSQSSSLEPPPKDPRRFSMKVRSVFAPSFPRAITKSTLEADDEGDPGNRESSSGYSTTDSSIKIEDYRDELALPRHQRSFVLPGEASPTPPPAAPPTSRRASSTRQRTASSISGMHHHSVSGLPGKPPSPLSTAIAVPVIDPTSKAAGPKLGNAARSRLSEPLSLVSNDSLSRSKQERPRLVQTNSRRPVSVEKAQRLSSLKAETEDTRPGSEAYDSMREAGLMPPSYPASKVGTQNSNMSGPAFL